MKINNYIKDTNVNANDKWIGSDFNNFGQTKNFSPTSIADYYNHNQVIDSAYLKFTYQTLNPGEQRYDGTISFVSEIGPSVAFSSISTFLLSKKSLKDIDVSNYIGFLNGGKVILSRGENIDDFGFYKITNIVEYVTDTNFFVVSLDYIAGHGSMVEDKDYLVSLVADSYTLGEIPTKTSDLTNDGEDGINPFITLQDLPTTTGTLQEILINGNETGGRNIKINNADAIELENTSLLKKGTYDFGGQGGISRICSVGYEDMWQSGIRHVFDNNGLIRNSTNCFNIVPDNTFDSNLRFKLDSRWTLDDGTTYVCTDATVGAAVWEVESNNPQNLEQVTDNGNTTTNGITVGSLTVGNLFADGYSFSIGSVGDWLLNYLPYAGLSLDDGLYQSTFITTGGLQVSKSDIKSFVDVNFDNISYRKYDSTGYVTEYEGSLNANGLTLKTSPTSVASGNIKTDLLTSSSKVYQLPDASGTIALTSNIGTWGTLNYPTWTTGAPFVKMTAAGTFSLDTNTYLTTTAAALTYYPIPIGTISQYIRGDGSLATFPSISVPNLNSVTSVGNSSLTPILLTSAGSNEYLELGNNSILFRNTGFKYIGLQPLSPATSTKTIYIPDSNGTMALLSDIPLTTKGDLLTYNSGNTRLPVGLDTQVLISDSTTPTGLKWGTNTAATPTGYYGAFSDITDQTASVINTGYPMRLGVTDLSNGVTVVSNSRITIANTGIYNIQWSAQFRNPTSSEQDVTIWLRKNGVDVPGSSGVVSVPKKHGATDGHTLPSWNFLLDPVAGDYYEFVWSTSDTSVYINFEAAGSPPPSTASVVLTVTQQSGIMAGTGLTAINSLTGAVQTLTTGTSGTNFAINSTGTTHTFNLPTASATNRGALSSTDWSAFNGKQSALGFTPFKWIATNTTPHTGTLSETTIAMATILGGTFNSSDVMKVFVQTSKPLTTNIVSYRIRINTTNTLAGAVQIGSFSTSNTLSYAPITRTFTLAGNNLIGNFTNAVSDLANTTGTIGTTAYNTANTLYVFFTVQLGNIADSATIHLMTITN